MPDQSNIAGTASFTQTQIQFAQHIRDPEKQPKPMDIEDRRMNIYRDLLYNNIENLLSSGFPVIRSIYTDHHWHKMVRDFFIRHRCKTPYFFEIAQEFISYLQNSRKPQAEDPAGLTELAHYEWVELALSIADDDIELNQINPNGDLLKSRPVLSPLAWSLAYQFPVHKMSLDYLPDEAPDRLTYLVVYRDRMDEIHFMEINEVSAHLLHQINHSAATTGYEILQDIAQQMNLNRAEAVVSSGLSSMLELQARGIILGTREV